MTWLDLMGVTLVNVVCKACLRPRDSAPLDLIEVQACT